MNIFGTPLQKCRTVEEDRLGSWDKEGYCSDRQYDTGIHQICLKMDKERLNFSTQTYQNDWSRTRKGNNHCVCVGAYSLWKARQNEQGKMSNNDLFCHAIPETAIIKNLEAWKVWNGHEKKHELDTRFRVGMESLYAQCIAQAENQQESRYLQNLFVESGIHG